MAQGANSSVSSPSCAFVSPATIFVACRSCADVFVDGGGLHRLEGQAICILSATVPTNMFTP